MLSPFAWPPHVCLHISPIAVAEPLSVENMLRLGVLRPALEYDNPAAYVIPVSGMICRRHNATGDGNKNMMSLFM